MAPRDVVEGDSSPKANRRMKIRMNTTSAGPEGVRFAGHVYDVPDEEARLLVNGHYAEQAGADEPVADDEKPVETADRKPPENASADPKRKR